MKKTQEILDLPIISISDGVEVGKVKSTIINADNGAIDYIVVDSGIQILSANVISTSDILGVGEYALTIENAGVINDISKIPAAVDLHQKNIQVKGTKVLTKKGRLIGEIGDIYIDENDSFRIIGLEYIADITQKRVRIIPRDSVITFGKNLLVVTEDVENMLLDRPSQLGSGDRSTEVEKKNPVSFSIDNQPAAYPPLHEIPVPVSDVVTEADRVIAVDGKVFLKEIDTVRESDPIEEFDATKEIDTIVENDTVKLVDTAAVEGPLADYQEAAVFPLGQDIQIEDEPLPPDNAAAAGQDIPKPAPETNAASLFEQRQRQYLNGRRATKTIMDNTGNVIVSEGTLINDEIIDTAKLGGKLIELIMNNKA